MFNATISSRRWLFVSWARFAKFSFLLAAALAFAATLVPQPASAAMNVRIVNTDGIGVASRSAPQLAARNGHGAPEGATVVLQCHAWGDPVGARANRLWDFVSYQGRQFYVPDLYTSSPTVANVPVPGIPFCIPQQQSPPPSNGDGRPGQAASWASSHVGTSFATGADHQLLKRYGRDSGWAPGPYGEWSGDCMRFAAAAWLSTGVVPLRGSTAKLVGDAYARSGRLKSGLPPLGTIVFYSWGRPGHAGISLGNGQVVSTRGVDGNRAKVRTHNYRLSGMTYRGWADPR